MFSPHCKKAPPVLTENAKRHVNGQGAGYCLE